MDSLGPFPSPIWLVPEGGLLLDIQMDIQPRDPEQLKGQQRRECCRAEGHTHVKRRDGF